MKRKIVAMLLSLALVVGLLPGAAFAQEEALSYVALGDSITSGYGLSSEEESFPNQIATEKGYTLTNLAKAGATSANLLEVVSSPDNAAALTAANVITITIGGNDLMAALYQAVADAYNAANPEGEPLDAQAVQTILAGGADPIQQTALLAVTMTVIPNFVKSEEASAALLQVGTNLTKVITAIRTVNPTAQIIVANQYNPYSRLGDQFTVSSDLDAVLTQLNGALAQGATAGTYTVADVAAAFASAQENPCNATMLPSVNLDFHPNAYGHKLIADTILALLAEDPDTNPDTNLQPEVTVTDGVASVTVSSDLGQSLVEQAKETGTAVIITPEITEVVSKIQFSLPAETISSLSSETTSDLVLSTLLATVTIPHGSLADLAGSEGNVTVSAAMETAGLSLAITANDTPVTTLSSGMTVVVSAANTSSSTVAVLLNADGTTKVIPKSVAGEGNVTIPLEGSATVAIVPDNSKTFQDTDGHWGSEAIDFTSSHQLFSGTSDTTFSPNVGMSRAMMVQVLYNLESNPETAVGTDFTDVQETDWFNPAVTWAVKNGITAGMGEGLFRPTILVTREQMAQMLYSYAKSAGLDTTVGDPTKLSQFTDVNQISTWAVAPMTWAVNNGLFSGMEDGTIAPQATATRAQVASVMMKFAETFFCG